MRTLVVFFTLVFMSCAFSSPLEKAQMVYATKKAAIDATVTTSDLPPGRKHEVRFRGPMGLVMYIPSSMQAVVSYPEATVFGYADEQGLVIAHEIREAVFFVPDDESLFQLFTNIFSLNFDGLVDAYSEHPDALIDVLQYKAALLTNSVDNIKRFESRDLIMFYWEHNAYSDAIVFVKKNKNEFAHITTRNWSNDAFWGILDSVR